MNLYLSGVLKLAFDLLHDLACNYDHLLVVDLFRLDRDTYLASRLNCIRLVHSGEAVSNFFKLLQPLDVIFKILAPCAGTCR